MALKEAILVTLENGDSYEITEKPNRLVVRLRPSSQMRTDRLVVSMPSGNVVEIEPHDVAEIRDYYGSK